jgi:hypothetical protein
MTLALNANSIAILGGMQAQVYRSYKGNWKIEKEELVIDFNNKNQHESNPNDHSTPVDSFQKRYRFSFKDGKIEFKLDFPNTLTKVEYK